MKQLLTLSLCLSFSCIHAQELSTERWKETTRLNLKEKEVTYTDTLILQRTNEKEMSLRKGSFLYKGKVDKKVLDMGYMTYTILKNKGDEIQLQDNDFIHVFHKDVKDQSAKDATEKMSAIELPEHPVGSIDRTMLAGNWDAYKRTGRNGPLSKVDYKILLKTLSFSLEKENGYYGYLTTNFIGGDALYSIKETQGSDIVADGKDKKEHRIKVWKIDQEELIIEDENGIIYYMKHFE